MTLRQTREIYCDFKEVDRTGLGSCEIGRFGTRGVELLEALSSVLVAFGGFTKFVAVISRNTLYCNSLLVNQSTDVITNCWELNLVLFVSRPNTSQRIWS